MSCSTLSIFKIAKIWFVEGVMAEWSKAVDLSPTISGCVGSNPTGAKHFFDRFSVSILSFLPFSSVNSDGYLDFIVS